MDAALKNALEKKREEFLNSMGCWCASTGDENNLPTNILMWSHYADSHKGMCLAFKRATLEKKFENEVKKLIDMKPVEYHQNPISLCPLCLISACNCSDITKPLYSKSSIWKYEQELRIFHKEPNKPYGYGAETLEAIYFGSKVDDTDLEIVCLIVQGQNKNTKFFKTLLKPNSYQVEFRQFYYKPHIDSLSVGNIMRNCFVGV